MKLFITGNPDECYHFMNDLKNHPNYEVKLEMKEYISSDSLQTRMAFNLSLLNKERSPLKVHLVTDKGQQIEFNLLDGVVVELEEITFVNGKIMDFEEKGYCTEPM